MTQQQADYLTEPAELLEGVTFEPPLPMLQRDLEAYEAALLPRLAKREGMAAARRHVVTVALELGWMKGLSARDLPSMAVHAVAALAGPVQQYVERSKRVPKGS